MKKLLSLLSITILLALILCACMSEEGKINEYIRRGDMYLEQGNLEAAENNYRAAEEAGEEKLTALLLMMAKNYMDEGNTARAFDCITRLSENAYSQKETAIAVMEISKKYIEGTTKSDQNYILKQEKYKAVKSIEEKIIFKDIPEYNDFIYVLGNEFTEYLIYLNMIDEAVNIWKEYSNHPTFKIISDSADLIKDNKAVEGLKLLRENLEDSKKYEELFINELLPIKNINLIESIDYHSAHAKILPQVDPELLDKNASWIKESSYFTDFKGSIERRTEADEIHLAEIESLKENCGKNGNNKILILNKRRPFNSKTTRLEVHDYTKYLPEIYVPECIEDIGYIILIENDYIDSGKSFESGTVLILENCKISVYKVGKQWPIYQSNKNQIKEPGYASILFNGDPPKYRAHKHPDMTSDIEKALKKIMDDIY